MAGTHDGYLYGLKTLKFGGKEIGMISDDSVEWGGDDPQTAQIWAAQNRTAPVKEIVEKPGLDVFEFDLIELKPSNLKDVLGGTVAAGKWNAPAAQITQEGAFEITTADGAILAAGKASLVARPKGRLGYSDVLKVHCKVTILADGTASPYSIDNKTA